MPHEFVLEHVCRNVWAGVHFNQPGSLPQFRAAKATVRLQTYRHRSVRAVDVNQTPLVSTRTRTHTRKQTHTEAHARKHGSTEARTRKHTHGSTHRWTHAHTEAHPWKHTHGSTHTRKHTHMNGPFPFRYQLPQRRHDRCFQLHARLISKLGR